MARQPGASEPEQAVGRPPAGNVVPEVKLLAQKANPPVPGQGKGASGSSAPGCNRCVITAFKTPIVTLFMSESGHDGQRVPKSAMPVPVVATMSDPAKPRLEIMTLDGPRWVAAADVTIEPKP